MHEDFVHNTDVVARLLADQVQFWHGRSFIPTILYPHLLVQPELLHDW